MFERISPERAGISSENILYFIKELEKYQLNTHSLILAKGNNIISETYYAPFHKDFKHRLYSVSKSFVSVALGLLIEDGKVSLDDKFIKFFPEYITEDECDEFLAEMTIRDALRMETCNDRPIDWFHRFTDDRTKLYFETKNTYIPGTLFYYDSPASYMMNVIVEKITGKPFLEFMKDRFLREIGFSEDSYCLKCPGGYSFGDSGVMCSARDLLTFARFVMNGGTWEGKRYMNEEYLKEASSYQVANSLYDIFSHSTLGYGYQIWQAPDGGFAFLGMGDQLAICDRKRDFIMIINSDNQGSTNSKFIIYHSLYEDIIEKLGEPLAEDPDAYNELLQYESTRRLNGLGDAKYSPAAEKISGRTYTLSENPMGIKTIRFEFDSNGGTIYYLNAQGCKAIGFGWGENVFQTFPQTGYSDMIAGAPCPGNTYECAASGGWLEEKKLHIKVQAIDKYFGTLHMAFSFKDSRIVVKMEKVAEAFFEEYQGIALGETEENPF